MNRTCPLGLAVVFLMFPFTAFAATLIVDATADSVDFGGAQQAGDLPGPDGIVTFREAAIAANNTSGPDTISFQIPLSDPGFTGGQQFLITVSFDNNIGLMITDDSTLIDGTTQTDFTGDTNPNGPEIAFRGNVLAINTNGITVFSNDNAIRGLGDFSFFRYGIQLLGNRNSVVSCATLNPMSAGVEIRGANNRIGGPSPEDGNQINSSGVGVWIRLAAATGNIVQGNLISGNRSSGVVIESDASGNIIGGLAPGERNVVNSTGHFSGESQPVGQQISCKANGNVIEGNYLGTDATGTLDQSGSAKNGIYLRGSNNTVRGNVVSGHGFTLRGHREGVLVHGGTGNIIQGNFIGTDPTGSIAIPNEHGIEVSIFLFSEVPADMMIGGTGPGEANVVAFNDEIGIGVFRSGPGAVPMGITISGNAIYGNGDLGIDLEGEGVTPNDSGDGDTGPNEFMNFPVIGTAEGDGGGTFVSGTIDTPSPETVTLEFFWEDTPDPSGNGEGEFFGGSVSPNGAGNFTLMLPGGLIGKFVTATATDASGNTSEFSVAVLVGSIPTSIDPSFPNDPPPVAARAHVYPNPFLTSTTLRFRLPSSGRVTGTVYDVRGRLIRKLIDREMRGGEHLVQWDGWGESGAQVAPGTYFIHLRTPLRHESHRVVMVR